jgi:hypothetical protein
MRYASVVSRILLGLAWLLLLVCMFLPLGGVVYKDSSYSLYGWESAVMAPLFGPLSFLSLVRGETAGDHRLEIIAIAVFLSELLFITSPFVLLVLRAGRLTSRSIYLVLNLICVTLLALLTPYIVSRLDPNTSQLQNAIHFLPGLWVWLGAQLLLTEAAAIQLVQAYLIKRRDLADSRPEPIRLYD